MEEVERQLWSRWKTRGDHAARDALIEHYSPWARSVAKSICRRVYFIRDAWVDCVQNALVGLIEAINRFDPEQGVPFQSYARHRVRGSIFNGLRVFLKDAPPAGAYQAHMVEDRMASLDGGEDPFETFVDLAVGLGIGHLLSTYSHDAGIQNDAYAEIERSQTAARLAHGAETLSERERLVLAMHYRHEVRFVDIAAHLGVTKGRISQIHAGALKKLRDYLGRSSGAYE